MSIVQPIDELNVLGALIDRNVLLSLQESWHAGERPNENAQQDCDESEIKRPPYCHI